MTFVQTQNHLEVKIYTLLPYMGINIAIRSDVIWPRMLRITDHAAFNTLSAKVAKNLVKWIDLSAMRQFGDVLREKNSFNFKSKFNSSWGSFWPINRSVFPRGNKFGIFLNLV